MITCAFLVLADPIVFVGRITFSWVLSVLSHLLIHYALLVLYASRSKMIFRDGNDP